ncbi:Protein of unknown function [Reichenbachiella faecimaris]|uniref:DUF3307 domain-containing protein n=1 Tax=Reichenbachiella faecimaris TaxID=692418 RepID=A0A1W2GQL1_REIFA|nr:DUF3307 domain-containing protein [Reichenbachiella faecimaris]SMD38970.1 Protein of unknown function [Reichenbachiella faecimaris]
MITLTLQLLLAHLIGDFLIQPDHWIKDKEEKKHKSKYLWAHLLIHALATLLLLQFDLSYWKGVLVIMVSHFIIDLVKINLQHRLNKRLLFFADQLAHLLVIAWVVYLYEPYTLAFSNLMDNQILLFVIALLTTTVVSSIFMKVIITKWELEEDINSASLEHAGKYIGMLERLFVFGFIVLDQWQAIGFLLAAKSVFRFGDLSKAKDRKLTEYILIGTLLSFGFAILYGLGYSHFKQVIDH